MQRTLLLAFALLLAAPAQGIVFISGDGQGNSTAPPDDPGWDHVGRVGGLNGVYLGNGWVLTANHVQTNATNFQGVLYTVVPGSEVQLQNPNLTLADLKVFKTYGRPNLPMMPIRATTPAGGTEVTMIAAGTRRGAPTTWDGYDGYYWGGSGWMQWATNHIYQSGFAGDSWTISTDFDKLADGTTHEGQGADGDSGGGLFIKNGSNWELAGILFAILPFPSQPASTSLHGKPSQPIGNQTFAIDLSIYRDQILDLIRPACENEIDDDGDTKIDWPADPDCDSALGLTELPDQDGDGVGDAEDNCLVDQNANQRDTNLDGYGNLCDGDFDDDGAVTGLDFVAFKQAYLKGIGDPGYDPDMDLDGGGAIGPTDFTIFRSMYLGAPGPSGLGCAGSPPCP